MAAILEEAKGKAFLSKCKGIATVIAAVSALILGTLNWFKEARDPRVQAGYSELAKQVEALSKDVRVLAELQKRDQEAVTAIQNWILYERTPHGAAPTSSISRMRDQLKAQPEIKLPPVRRLMPLDGLMMQQATK